MPEIEEGDFLYGIAEEHHDAVSGFNDKGALAKGYSELFSKMGTSVQMLNENSSAEEIAAFYKKLGSPDTIDGYTLPQLPEGKEYDKDLLGGMREAMLDVGITDKQFGKLLESYLAIEVKKSEANEAEKIRASEEGDRVLKEKWGANYEAESAIVQRACDELIPNKELHDEFAQLIEDKGLKNNRVFALVFNGIGKKMLDDTFVKGGGHIEGKEYTPVYPNDPDMYRSGTDDESKRARAWHEKRGHVY